jgi:hypothetical protein
MKRFSKTQLEAAQGYLRQHGRPVDRALFACALLGARPSLVAQALGTYQNRDGGLGQGLEPDVRCAASSALATSLGLWLAREAGVGDDHIVPQRAMLWLINHFDRAAHGWPIVPPEVASAPAAPWWTFRPATACLLNPRAQIVSHFHAYPELVEDDFRTALTDAVVRAAEAAAAPLEAHDFACCVQLAEAPGLPAAERARLHARLRSDLPTVVCTERARWTGYVCRPLDVVTRPDGLLAEELAGALADNLDYLIDEQLPDGSWPPVWDWGGAHPAAWATAQRDWASYLTARHVILLKRFGRLEG